MVKKKLLTMCIQEDGRLIHDIGERLHMVTHGKSNKEIGCIKEKTKDISILMTRGNPTISSIKKRHKKGLS